MVISIHSLVKRETSGAFHNGLKVPISIHSLVKRETMEKVLVWFLDTISIHSLVKRETSNEPQKPLDWMDFNPLPRKEGDINVVTLSFYDRNFNPLPRKEGDHG